MARLAQRRLSDHHSHLASDHLALLQRVRVFPFPYRVLRRRTGPFSVQGRVGIDGRLWALLARGGGRLLPPVLEGSRGVGDEPGLHLPLGHKPPHTHSLSSCCPARRLAERAASPVGVKPARIW